MEAPADEPLPTPAPVPEEEESNNEDLRIAKDIDEDQMDQDSDIFQGEWVRCESYQAADSPEIDNTVLAPPRNREVLSIASGLKYAKTPRRLQNTLDTETPTAAKPGAKGRTAGKGKDLTETRMCLSALVSSKLLISFGNRFYYTQTA